MEGQVNAPRIALKCHAYPAGTTHTISATAPIGVEHDTATPPGGEVVCRHEPEFLMPVAGVSHARPSRAAARAQNRDGREMAMVGEYSEFLICKLKTC